MSMYGSLNAQIHKRFFQHRFTAPCRSILEGTWAILRQPVILIQPLKKDQSLHKIRVII